MKEIVYDEAGLDFRDWCVAEGQLPYGNLSYARVAKELIFLGLLAEIAPCQLAGVC